ncbi:MAG: ribosome silencing factor [Limnochordia bacterium]|jgi:ribosome-associated protein
MVALAIEAAEGKKAEDIVVLDLRELTALTDYFLICSGETDQQRRAIRDGIVQDLKEAGAPLGRQEGGNRAQWMLLDYGDMVVHIFSPEQRSFYDLERLWGDAPRVDTEALAAMVQE